MVKVNEIKGRKTKKRAKITVGSLISKVRTKLNEERVNKIIELLEEKYRTLDEAQAVVAKIEKQIAELENKDIMEVDLEDYEY